MYKTRHIEKKIKQLKNNFKVILLVGARQVGKSTLLKHLLPDLKHIVFDPVQDLHGAKEDPDLFLQNFPPPIILDEIQYVPQLLSAIKRKVDLSDVKGQYFLTGSQNISILKNISESLAGRVAILNLGGMTIYEENDISEKHWISSYLRNSEDFYAHKFKLITASNSLYKIIWRGGFPGLLGMEDGMVPVHLSSYFQTYVERDVRLIENIKDLTLFDRFLGIASALTAQEINTSHFGREVGINHVTAAKWLNLIEHSYLWNEALPFSGNSIKVVSKKRKGYISDTGLACYLQRISSPEGLARHPLLGPLFESFCVNMIFNITKGFSLQPKFYHWRSAAGAEVDLILELNGVLFPIEMKCKTSLSKHDTRGIRAFKEAYPHLNVALGVILYCGQEVYLLNHDIVAIPYNAYLEGGE